MTEPRIILNQKTRLHAAPDLEVHELEDGFLVYQPEADRVHRLNHTAAALLELCRANCTTTELPGLLAQAFNLPEPPVEDVRDCLQQLLAEGLVHS